MRNAIARPIGTGGPLDRRHRPRAGQGCARTRCPGCGGASSTDRSGPAGSDETRSPSGHSRYRTAARLPRTPPRRPNRVSSSGSTKPTQRRATAILAKMPPHSGRELLRPKQDSRILKRSGVLVDQPGAASAPGAHPRWSRSGDYQIMRPATLRPDSPAFATILPNFH